MFLKEFLGNSMKFKQIDKSCKLIEIGGIDYLVKLTKVSTTKNQIKYIRGLSLKKNRIKEQRFVVEGEKCLEELLNSSFEIVELFALKDWIDKHKSVFEIEAAT